MTYKLLILLFTFVTKQKSPPSYLKEEIFLLTRDEP